MQTVQISIKTIKTGTTFEQQLYAWHICIFRIHIKQESYNLKHNDGTILNNANKNESHVQPNQTLGRRLLLVAFGCKDISTHRYKDKALDLHLNTVYQV